MDELTVNTIPKMEQIKLVIWDLDETFWRGTLSEGEIIPIPQNIQLIKKLTDKGIVNSICSKNDFTKVEAKLKEFGIWELFVFPSIDWSNKGARVKGIIENMQLRPINVLFVDDNINNLKEAQFECLDLNIADPKDIIELVNTAAFEGKDDRAHSRLQQYKILEQRAAAISGSGSKDAFLYQSEIECDIIHDWGGEMERAYELIHRTNQLNFKKNRISKEETAALIYEADYSGLVRVKDKYGDHGFVGFFAVKKMRGWE